VRLSSVDGGLVGMGKKVTGIPIIWGVEREAVEQKRMGDKEASASWFETKRIYRSALAPWVKLKFVLACSPTLSLKYPTCWRGDAVSKLDLMD